jgi:putative flippase GtrA
MLTAYALTRLFVFERSGPLDAERAESLRRRQRVSVVQTWIVAVALVRLVFPRIGFATEPELVAHAIGLVCASVTSYLGHRHYSFGKR